MQATQLEDIDAIREQFLAAEASDTVRVVAVVVSFTLLGTVLWLVRRRVLREEYTPIWVTAALAVFLVSWRLDLLRDLARLIGAWTVSSTLFLLGQLFFMALCLNYAVRFSRQSGELKALAQESAILRAKIEALEADAARAPRAPSEQEPPEPVDDSGRAS